MGKKCSALYGVRDVECCTGNIAHGYGMVAGSDEEREVTVKTGTKRAGALDVKRMEEAASNSIER